MEINDAIDQLAKWCTESSGAPLEIAPGRTLAFASHAVFGENEIRVIEDRLGFNLPSSYRQFMSAVGQSIVFREARYGTGGMHFFSPEEAINASLTIWNEEAKPGTDRFCFIGWHRSMGD